MATVRIYLLEARDLPVFGLSWCSVEFNGRCQSSKLKWSDNPTYGNVFKFDNVKYAGELKVSICELLGLETVAEGSISISITSSKSYRTWMSLDNLEAPKRNAFENCKPMVHILVEVEKEKEDDCRI